MFCDRSFLILSEFSRDAVASIKDTSLSCTVSSTGTWANKMGLVERDNTYGRSNDARG